MTTNQQTKIRIAGFSKDIYIYTNTKKLILILVIM